MFRYSTLQEREEFYKNEFNIIKLASWLKNLFFQPQFFVIDVGTETKIVKYPAKLNKLIILKPNFSLKKLKQKLLKYLPEDVYYDRNVYKDPSKCLQDFDFSNAFQSDNFISQELVFDIDPENINCPKCHQKFPNFCNNCSKLSVEKAILLSKELKKQFKKIEVVFSGRGAHVHVFDKNAYFLSLKERVQLNIKFKKFAIDSWVSHGKIRLIRLPYTLNAISSKIATPLNPELLNKFNPDSPVLLPKFLL